jgi:transcriptional regulator of acetoin/glycerol metabolism
MGWQIQYLVDLEGKRFNSLLDAADQCAESKCEQWQLSCWEFYSTFDPLTVWAHLDGVRPFKLDEKRAAMARQLLKAPDATVTEVSKVLGVSRSTPYRYVPASERPKS